MNLNWICSCIGVKQIKKNEINLEEIQNDIIIVNEENINIKKKQTILLKEKKIRTNIKNKFINSNNNDDYSLISDYDSTSENSVKNKSMNPKKKKSNFSNYKYNNCKKQISDEYKIKKIRNNLMKDLF